MYGRMTRGKIMLGVKMQKIKEQKRWAEMWEDASVISSDGRSEQTQKYSPLCSEEGEKEGKKE